MKRQLSDVLFNLNNIIFAIEDGEPQEDILFMLRILRDNIKYLIKENNIVPEPSEN